MSLVLPTDPEARKSIAVVLAAGDGKRMRSPLPKVAHEILGKSMLEWVLDAAFEGGSNAVVAVVAPHHPQVHALLKAYGTRTKREVEIAIQAQAQGTGHAVLCALPAAVKFAERFSSTIEMVDLLVAFGDTPGLSANTVSEFLRFHRKQKNAATVLACELENPTGYGRILTNAAGNFLGIREEKDCTAAERLLRLCNSGLLCVGLKDAAQVLPKLSKENAAGEYYLTDLPSELAASGKQVGVFASANPDELHGVNSPEQLAEAEARLTLW